jgi:kynurenine formamidase
MSTEHPIAGGLPPQVVVNAAPLVRNGKQFSLAVPRFPGMPLFAGHPPFQVMSYRTPQGIRQSGAEPWGPGNDIELGYMCELVIGTSHSGAHVDALAHMTVGTPGRWYGGANAEEDLGDFGPTHGDASELPPFFTRGVLLDAAGWMGVESLPGGHALTADDLREIARSQGVEVRKWDVVLIRTGLLAHWPDEELLARHRGAGPDISAARWLSSVGVIATGSDTETYEVQPAPDRGVPSNPQPVHTHLLIDEGIYLFESLYLEELAAAGVHEFLFVALPVKINGATGSMLDPLALT